MFCIYKTFIGLSRVPRRVALSPRSRPHLHRRQDEGQRRTYRHPAPPGSQFHPPHHALPAPGAGANRGHALTAAPDGVPCPSLTGAHRQPPGTAAGAGGGRFPQGTGRALPGKPPALDSATAGRQGADVLPNRFAAKCNQCSALTVQYASDRHSSKCQTLSQTRWVERRCPICWMSATGMSCSACRTNSTPWPNGIPTSSTGCCSRPPPRPSLSSGATPVWLSGEIGFTLVLHTWGQNLGQHIHVHGDAFDCLNTVLREHDWVVYTKPPFANAAPDRRRHHPVPALRSRNHPAPGSGFASLGLCDGHPAGQATAMTTVPHRQTTVRTLRTTDKSPIHITLILVGTVGSRP